MMILANDWIRTPQQARSQRTLQHILDSTEMLYRTSAIEKVSIPAIVTAAGTSIGAFYSRFPSRLALTQVLHERFYADAQALVDDLLEKSCFSTDPWPLVFSRLIETTIVLFSRHRGFMKAAFYHTRIQPDPDCVERARLGNQAVLGRVAQLLLPRRAEIGHPDPEVGMAMMLDWMTSSVRESVVFGKVGESRSAVTQEELIHELVRMMTAYLDVPCLR